MIIKDCSCDDALPLYEVKELSMEEALLVLAAEKESLRQRIRAVVVPPAKGVSRSGLSASGSAAA